MFHVSYLWNASLVFSAFKAVAETTGWSRGGVGESENFIRSGALRFLVKELLFCTVEGFFALEHELTLARLNKFVGFLLLLLVNALLE